VVTQEATYPGTGENTREEREETFVGTGENTKAVSESTFIKITGSITDKDDAGGDDVMDLLGGFSLGQVSEEWEISEFSFLLTHTSNGLEGMQVKVTIEVVPILGFY
jgi:hypothetical protein